MADGKDNYPPLEMPSGNSLQEMLDAVVVMYHIAAHKQLGKVCFLFVCNTTRCFSEMYPR